MQNHFQADNSSEEEHNEDVVIVEGYFFIKNDAIKENSKMVERSFSNLYKYVSDN